jgi:uncharacterized protein (DUF342 family)
MSSKIELEQLYKLNLSLTEEELKYLQLILMTFKRVGEPTKVVINFPGTSLLADSILHTIERTLK